MTDFTVLPSGIEPFARQMFEAITEVCRLPESNEKRALLKTLNDVVTLAACPMVMLDNERFPAMKRNDN